MLTKGRPITIFLRLVYGTWAGCILRRAGQHLYQRQVLSIVVRVAADSPVHGQYVSVIAYLRCHTL